MWVYNGEEIEVADFLRKLLDSNEDWLSCVVDDMLDECYEPWKFGGETFYPSKIVKEVNPFLYDEIIEEEKDNIISDWIYKIDRYSAEKDENLYEFLYVDSIFKDTMSKVIWENDEDEEQSAYFD